MCSHVVPVCLCVCVCVVRYIIASLYICVRNAKHFSRCLDRLHRFSLDGIYELSFHFIRSFVCKLVRFVSVVKIRNELERCSTIKSSINRITTAEQTDTCTLSVRYMCTIDGRKRPFETAFAYYVRGRWRLCILFRNELIVISVRVHAAKIESTRAL